MNPTDIDQIHEILFRLIVATLLGAILGIDRDLHRKPAGLRVLAMVGLGACGVVMASIMLEHSTSDGLLRAIQGVLTGIGFLGAGVIMRAQGKDEVHGLTTAATIWISAIVGLICGTGQFLLACSVFAIAWLLLIGGRWIEWRIICWTVSHNQTPKLDSIPTETSELNVKTMIAPIASPSSFPSKIKNQKSTFDNHQSSIHTFTKIAQPAPRVPTWPRIDD